MEYIICTTDIDGHECWTNPPSKTVSEIWEFIYRMIDKPIESFRFMYGEKEYKNPKRIFIQGELF